jgi:sensor histidine kinase regulating citrate/malate metabolism
MGLFIVSKIIKEAGGEIKVTSSKDKTGFFFELPKLIEAGSMKGTLAEK